MVKEAKTAWLGGYPRLPGVNLPEKDLVVLPPAETTAPSLVPSIPDHPHSHDLRSGQITRASTHTNDIIGQ